MFGNEIEILQYIQGLRVHWLNKVFEIITMFGEETIMIILVAVLYFAVDKRIAQKLFYICIMSLSVNGILKNIVKIPRPFANGKIICVRPDTATGYSFPSGHTQTFSTASTAIGLEIKRKWLISVVGIAILLMAFSRVYLGAHYVSDVVVGAILGVMFAVLGNIIYEKFEEKTKLYLITALILTPFVLYFLIVPDLLYGDFFKIYGMIIGLFLAVKFEEKYAPLEYNVSLWKKIIRVVLGIVIAYVIKEGIKIIYIFNSVQIFLILDAIRYMILMFTMLGVYPLIIKKVKL